MRFSLATGLLLAFSLPIFGQSLRTEARVVSLPGAPVTITAYTAHYQERISTTYMQQDRGIKHEVEYQNNSEKKVVAVEIGLVSFDVWNEFLDRTGGIAMNDVAPQAKKKGAWLATAYADFAFQTGVAYVSKVRFESGEVWIADVETVVSELRKIQKDFDAKQLTKKGGGS